MSIRERAGSFLNKLHDKAGYGKAVTASDLEQFSESERALQRQECAEAVRLWLIGDDAGIEMGAWWDELKTAILTAGVEPQNPFGCECEWEQDPVHSDVWRLLHRKWTHNSDNCDHCPKCGKAKRGET